MNARAPNQTGLVICFPLLWNGVGIVGTSSMLESNHEPTYSIQLQHVVRLTVPGPRDDGEPDAQKEHGKLMLM